MNCKKMLRLAIAGLIVTQVPGLETVFANQSSPLSPSTTQLAQAKPATPAKPLTPAPTAIPLTPAPTTKTPATTTTTTTAKPKPVASKKPRKNKLTKIVRRGIKYKFSCVSGTTTALVATRPGKQPSSPIPLIRWTDAGSKEFGDSYTPEARCATVTARFNRHFIKKGKVVATLPTLRVGKLNRLKVVCASRGACTSETLLWTLKSANAKNPAIIAQLRQLIKNPKAGVRPIFESNDDEPEFESEDADAVEMEEVIGSAIATQLESEDPELAAALESEDAELESTDPEVIAEEPELESDEAELESEDAELESEDAELESEDAELESSDEASEEL
jgi:hypothetical protein